ncbi:restriction endonuclease subunit S [Bacillus pseudomycoides]|uniref:restriction endonuclease subunit S n=1 Tax=Bacillus pseudomycoides TaxID=64104 RepID=UPI000BF67D93|nr:restriction endonuclease subunit S [Bacillus pseudomycoides]PEP54599.1 type I restriction endonuclease subunit S [Bacillus pseudomycoides]PGR96881.1 type I restriction endonuclease subunit S [Bacillus pseudomycoides]PHC92745.1 type I restriction endonuclease subunit S [Bacillus pseudomycoides]
MINNHTPDIRFVGFTKDWEQRKLSDIKDVRDGTHDSPKYYNEGFPLVTSKNLTENGLDMTDVSLISEEDFQSINKRSKVDIGDIIFGMIGTIGNPIIVDREGFAIKNVALIKHGGEVTNEFLVQLLKSPIFRKYIRNENAGNTQKFLGLSKIRDYQFLSPSHQEQIKIGKFFKQLDDTIALLQQELTTLKQTKQGLVQKMFPKEGESVPEVRFSGFTGDWEQRKLDSIVDRLKSYSLSRDVETSEYTGYKYIHYGDIHTKVADVIEESSNLPNIKAGNYELLEKGDLVLADASEDYQGIAKPAVITIDTPYKLVSGLHTIALRPKQIDSLFLYYLINSPIFRKYGYRVGTGMKVFGISVTNLLKFESMFPLLEEQVKIGKFFKQLDDTIALHQRELDALKETKKAFLQKMFA